jgi:N-acetylneuraminic acid mutarotase
MICTMAYQFLFLLPLLLSARMTAADELVWESRTDYPGAGRHHPITFANESHGFLLTGSTNFLSATSDFYMYNEATDEWTDLTLTASAFPGKARSFGYGLVLNIPQSAKAYLGFGAAQNGERLSDLWEFDMTTHAWKELAEFPGPGRRHPAMVPVAISENNWEIQVGLGDGVVGGSFSNLNDWWSYSIASDEWSGRPDFPSSKRHHPFYFGIGNTSYAGFGHAASAIERDWYSFHASTQNWKREIDLASYEVVLTDGEYTYSEEPTTTEARVAGTQFSIELPSGSLGFVLSGDGDDHRTMEHGEFHAFYPSENGMGLEGPNNADGISSSWWRQLPPHPGTSRWAPGSFVMRGTARAYFTSGLDRATQIRFADLWMIDLSPLFAQNGAPMTTAPSEQLSATPTSPTPSTSAPDATPLASPNPTAPNNGNTSGSFIYSLHDQGVVILSAFLLAHFLSQML